MKQHLIIHKRENSGERIWVVIYSELVWGQKLFILDAFILICFPPILYFYFSPKFFFLDFFFLVYGLHFLFPFIIFSFKSPTFTKVKAVSLQEKKERKKENYFVQEIITQNWQDFFELVFFFSNVNCSHINEITFYSERYFQERYDKNMLHLNLKLLLEMHYGLHLNKIYPVNLLLLTDFEKVPGSSCQWQAASF